MKRFLTIGFIFCFFNSFSQTGYDTINHKYFWYAGRFKALQIPAGSGFPSFISQQWTGAGALMADTTAKKVYWFNGSIWMPFADSTFSSGLTSVKTVNGDSLTGGGTANIITDYSLRVYAALGSQIKAQTVGMTIHDLNSSQTLASGQLRVIAIYLPQDVTITGVKWYQVTAGNYTANNDNKVALYSYSAGTLTLIDSSDNDGNIWKAASNTWGSKAFHSTHLLTHGLYFVSVLYNNSAQVTAPVIGGHIIPAGNASNSADFTNSAKLYGIINNTVIPGSISMASISGITTVVPLLTLY